MLVHGEKEGMLKLARVLQRELGIPVYTPPTGQTVSIPLEKVEARVPVYIHNRCFRRCATNPCNATPSTSPPTEMIWQCDDPAVSYAGRAPLRSHSH